MTESQSTVQDSIPKDEERLNSGPRNTHRHCLGYREKRARAESQR